MAEQRRSTAETRMTYFNRILDVTDYLPIHHVHMENFGLGL